MNILNEVQAREFACETKKGPLKGYHVNNPPCLSDTIKDRLFPFLYPVALSAFTQEDTVGIAKDVYQHIFSGEGLLIVTSNECENEVPVAFRMWDRIYNVYSYKGDILYLAGMCVRKDYQKTGIGMELLRYVLSEDHRSRRLRNIDQVCVLPDCQYIALRTQNPVMKRAFDEAIGGISYPTGDGKEIPEEIQEVGARVAEYLKDESFDQHTLISRGLYGKSLYGHNPNSDNQSYEGLFSTLNKDDGDAMVCLWQCW